MSIPSDKQDWYSRFVESYGPSFRIDINNPQMGYGGAEVYSLYAVTESNEKSSISFDQSGKLKIHSDLTIEIVAGEKNTPKNEEILIHSRNGNITIKADKNGAIKISGKNITIEADYDLELTAGNDIKLRAGNYITQNSNSNLISAFDGNGIPKQLTFLSRVFDGISGIDGGIPIGEDLVEELAITVAKKVNPFN